MTQLSDKVISGHLIAFLTNNIYDKNVIHVSVFWGVNNFLIDIVEEQHIKHRHATGMNMMASA